MKFLFATVTATLAIFVVCAVLPSGEIERGTQLHPVFPAEKKHGAGISSTTNDGSSGSLGNIPPSVSNGKSPAMEEIEENNNADGPYGPVDEEINIFYGKCRSYEEAKLERLVNNYRAENEKYQIPVSKTMTKVSWSTFCHYQYAPSAFKAFCN